MKKQRRKLKDLHRAYVVKRLACFDTPKEVAEAVRQEFGIEITPQSIEHYDATKRAAHKLAKQWVDLFHETRAEFLEHVEVHVPGVHKAVRLKMLWHAALAFKSRNNYMAMADLLERMAKEVGKVYTNRREHTGKDGGPIRYREIEDMTDEQLDQELDEYVVEGLEAMKAAGKDVHPAKETEQ